MKIVAPSDTSVPDLEELAAYLDGRLSAERRGAVERRLADDADYKEVFLDTVRFREEDEAAAPSVGSGRAAAPPRTTSAAPWAVPLAVAATLLLMLGVWRPWQASTEERFYALADASFLAQQAYDRPREWPRDRSGGTSPLRSDEKEGFRLGTYWVDLRLSVLADDRAMVQHWLYQIDGAGRQLNLFGFSAQPVLSRLEEGASIETLRPELDALEALFERRLSSEPELQRVVVWGRWSEHVVMAALGRHDDVLSALLEDVPKGLRDRTDVQEGWNELLAAARQLQMGDEEARRDVVREALELQGLLG